MDHTIIVQIGLLDMEKVVVDLSHVHAAIFDMDGTLVNNMGFHKRAWKTFLQGHGKNLTEAFDVILGDEHVSQSKPNPEIYLETAKKLEVAPEFCLVFEDSPPGVEAGKNAGMKVVGLLTSHMAGELERADYIVEDYTRIEFR